MMMIMMILFVICVLLVIAIAKRLCCSGVYCVVIVINKINAIQVGNAKNPLTERRETHRKKAI